MLPSYPRLLALGFAAASISLRSVSARAVSSVDVLEARQNGSDFHWVDTWVSMPQLVESNNLPPSPFGSGSAMFKDASVRQTLHLSIGGDKFRIEISNTFGGSDLPITAASIALPAGGKAGVSGIQGTPVSITFSGSASVTVPKGQVKLSDEIAFPVPAQTMITVTLYLQQGQSGNSITGHPGSRTTSWYATGNQVKAATISGSSSAHWYFISAVQVWAPSTTGSLVILGDSITDGRGSEDNANNRWPDLVLAKMQSGGITNLAVLNQAAGGNAVLNGGLGPTLLSRYKRDGLNRPAVKYVMIFEGTNDIGSSSGTAVGDQLINAYKTIIADARKLGYKTIGATITPFCGSGQSYCQGSRDSVRQKVNTWILGAGNFDYVVDFDKILRSSSTTNQLDAKYNSGDGLHPNVAGYQAIANAFPLDILK